MSAWKSVVLTPEQQRAVVQFAVRGVTAAQADKIQARAQALVAEHQAGYLAFEPSGFTPDRVVAALYQLAGVPQPQPQRQAPRGERTLSELPAIYLSTGHTASTYSQPHAAIGPQVAGPTLPAAPLVDVAQQLAAEEAARYQRQARRQASAIVQYQQAVAKRVTDAADDQAAEARIQALRFAIRKGLEEGAC